MAEQHSRLVTDRDRLYAYIREHAEHGQARVIHSSVPGKEITLAHIIGTSTSEIYHNLGLDIGFHAGEVYSGESIGILRLSPAESVVIAADVATKAGDIDLGFMDRFSGALIITGARAEVQEAIHENVRYFRDELHYHVCPVSER